MIIDLEIGDLKHELEYNQKRCYFAKFCYKNLIYFNAEFTTTPTLNGLLIWIKIINNKNEFIRFFKKPGNWAIN
jgi:hypothetical protein